MNVEDRPGPARTRVVAIIGPDGKLDGKIIVALPKDGAGQLHASLWTFDGNKVQNGWAGGCGYDKLAAALDGMTFRGVRLTDHPRAWDRTLEDAGYTVETLL